MLAVSACFGQTVSDLTKKASEGDLSSQLTLGEKYRFGIGVDQDSCVMLALIQYLILAWVDPKKVPEFAKQFPPLLWLTIGLLLLFRSCYLAWKDQAMETIKVTRELEDERSIKNAPDVGLELLDGRLLIVNRSTDRDAHNVTFRSVGSGGYTIEAQPIPFLGRTQKMPYPVSAAGPETPKTKMVAL